MKNNKNRTGLATNVANSYLFKTEFAEANAAVKKKNTAAEPSDNTQK